MGVVSRLIRKKQPSVNMSILRANFILLQVSLLPLHGLGVILRLLLAWILEISLLREMQERDGDTYLLKAVVLLFGLPCTRERRKIGQFLRSQ